MTEIRKVLVPLAPGQPLDKRVNTFIEQINDGDAEIKLLTIIDDLKPFLSEGSYLSSHFELLELAQSTQLQRLETIKSQLLQHYPNLTVSCEVLSGYPFVGIIDVSTRMNCDVILIDVNRGNKRYASQYGSTTRHLIRKSKIPVWSMSSHRDAGMSSIVAAIDVAGEDSLNSSINQKILSYAKFVAQRFHCPLTIIHVWQLYGEDYLKHWGKLDAIRIAEMAVEEKQKRQQLCENLLAQQGIDTTQAELVLIEGEPSEAIPNYVETNFTDLLVVGTLSRTGLAGFFIGNTAESLLDAVDCSILTLKPDGFVSPLDAIT